MYYGDVIASYKQVTYSGASITLSLLQAVDLSGKGSATRVLLHLADSAILCILHAELQILHVAAIIISLFNTSCKNDTKSEPTERLPSL